MKFKNMYINYFCSLKFSKLGRKFEADDEKLPLYVIWE